MQEQDRLTELPDEPQIDVDWYVQKIETALKICNLVDNKYYNLTCAPELYCIAYKNLWSL